MNKFRFCLLKFDTPTPSNVDAAAAAALLLCTQIHNDFYCLPQQMAEKYNHFAKQLKRKWMSTQAQYSEVTDADLIAAQSVWSIRLCEL